MSADVQLPFVAHVIFARRAPVATVFVALPGGRTQLAVWHLQDDSIECGDTHGGTIYFRRSDVSPDGTRLLYFASQDPGAQYDASRTSTWTAMSILPRLAPVALWPKGDPLAGGGLFHDDNHIWLNHKSDRAATHASFPAPNTVSVNPNAYASGEDYPIYANRLQRDGWKFTQHGDFRFRGGAWIAETEEVCVKSDHTRRYELQMTMYKIEKRSKGSVPFYRFAIRDTVSGESVDLDNCHWADWDNSGRLCLTKGAALLAGSVSPGARLDMELIADFSKLLDPELNSAT